MGDYSKIRILIKYRPYYYAAYNFVPLYFIPL